MKVVFKNMVGGFTGRGDDMIYYYLPRLNGAYVRRRPRPVESEQHRRLAAVQRNLRLIHPAADYIQDFKDYMVLYNQMSRNKWHPVFVWNNLYQKMLYAMAAQDDSIDLTILSRADIYANNLPCVSLKTAVEAGLLPKVKGWEGFVALI